MQRLIALSSLLALAPLASAQEAPAAEKCATKCPSSCALTSSEGTLLKIAVTGLDNPQSAASAEVVLGAQSAISYCKSCPESNTVTIKYNPEKTTIADIEKTLTDNHLKITGHQTAFKIKGMMCQSCSNHLTSLLGKTEGVINIDQIDHLTGTAQITFDPEKTTATKLKAAINNTKYKVVDPKKTPATAAAPKT